MNSYQRLGWGNTMKQLFSPHLRHRRKSGRGGRAKRFPLSAGASIRFVPHYYSEWNRRGLIRTKRRKLRQRTAVGWTVWTVAERNCCIQAG